MRFYKDKQNDIFCAPCVGMDKLPRDDLTYVGVTEIPEGIFKCASCEERFMVYDGRVFMEVT